MSGSPLRTFTFSSSSLLSPRPSTETPSHQANGASKVKKLPSTPVVAPTYDAVELAVIAAMEAKNTTHKGSRNDRAKSDKLGFADEKLKSARQIFMQWAGANPEESIAIYKALKKVYIGSPKLDNKALILSATAHEILSAMGTAKKK